MLSRDERLVQDEGGATWPAAGANSKDFWLLGLQWGRLHGSLPLTLPKAALGFYPDPQHSENTAWAGLSHLQLGETNFFTI